MFRLIDHQGAFPVVDVEYLRRDTLFEIARTFDAFGSFPSLIQRGQQHARQNRDDRNYNEKLYKGKSCRRTPFFFEF